MRMSPLPQGFGVEITGFDIHGGRDPKEIAALRATYDEHHLVIFRSDGRIDPERQVEITGWFGPVSENVDNQGRAWTILHNDDAAGALELPFHCDISYMEFPLEGISLHPQELPRGETSTTFVSNAVAWNALPGDMQDELRPLKARHYYADSKTMNMDWPVFEYWHPVCLAHRRTGQPLLFVTEHHVDKIAGVPEERGGELLKALFAELYAPQRRYEHVWRKGDLLIWDNCAIQHARTRNCMPSEGVRALQRVSLGIHGFLDQLEKLQAAARPE